VLAKPPVAAVGSAERIRTAFVPGERRLAMAVNKPVGDNARKGAVCDVHS